MNQDDIELVTRRTLLTGMGLTAAGMTVGAASTALAQETPEVFSPKQYTEDRWLDDIPGDHRAFIDSSRPLGGSEALAAADGALELVGRHAAERQLELQEQRRIVEVLRMAAAVHREDGAPLRVGRIRYEGDALQAVAALLVEVII